MSSAKPMTPRQRRRNYGNRGLNDMTSAQHRRWWRKLRRYHHGDREAIGTELLRTPS